MSGRIRWLGHATVVIDVDGVRLVTDPVLRRRVMHLRRAASVEAPQVDAVLLSHLHYDHLDVPSLAQIGIGTHVFVPLGGRKWLRGFERVTEVEPGQEVNAGDVRIRVVDAHHDGRRRNMGPPVAAVGYVIDASTSIYFAGDTDLFDGMRELAPIDVALLPVSGWGPKVEEGHMDPARAA